MDDMCELLETYSGRDKVVRLGCYVLKSWGHALARGGGAGDAELGAALLRAGSSLSAARVALRLFDDVPTLRHTLAYGLGAHEPSAWARALGLASCAVDQLFLPVEKACWLQEAGVLRLSAERARALDTLNTLLWLAGAALALLQALRRAALLRERRRMLQAAGGSCPAAARAETELLRLERLAALKQACDVVQAGSCLPRGLLWGARLPPLPVALLATASSLLALYVHFAKKRLSRAK